MSLSEELGEVHTESLCTNFCHVLVSQKLSSKVKKGSPWQLCGVNTEGRGGEARRTSSWAMMVARARVGLVMSCPL